MKSEKFDEAIRRKFEDMENSIPVSEKDLDALQHYVNAGIKSPVYAAYIKSIVLISFIGILLASLFSWSLFLQVKHSNMAATIDSLQLKIRDQQSHKIIYKTDTMYIAGANRKVFVKNSLPRYSPSEKIQQYATAVPPALKTKTLSPIGSNKKNLQTLTEQDQNISKNLQTDPSTKGPPQYLSPKDSLIVNTVPDEVQSARAPIDTSHSVNNAPLASSNFSSNFKSLLSPLKNSRIQVGIGTQKGNRQSGNELVLGLLFTERWSLATGLRLLKINHEQYENNGEFSDSSAIRNIGTQSTLIQVPVTLSYALPLRKEYALLFGLGTDIDLSSRQHIGYDRMGYSMPVERKNLETQNTVVILNNMVFSTGVQKQWRKFSLQLSAFVSPQITPVIYKKDKLYSGLRFRLLYNFGK